VEGKIRGIINLQLLGRCCLRRVWGLFGHVSSVF
jgi:hypothetical protein